MLQRFQNPVSSQSAAIQIALSETWPPKRNRSEEFLDFNWNEKPLGTEFAVIWFREGKPHQRAATARAPQSRSGQAGVSPALLLLWCSLGTYTPSDGLYQPQNDKVRRAEASFPVEIWSESWVLSTLQPGNTPAPWQASGRDLPQLLPVPWLSTVIFRTNLAQKSCNSALRCCASTRTPAELKKRKVVCLLSQCGGFCMVRAEQSEAVSCAGIFFLKRRL